MFNRFLIALILIATFHLVAIFVSMILLGLAYLQSDEYRGKGLLLLKIALQLAGGFLVSVSATWFVVAVPFGWNLPIWETIYAAGFRADVYGNEVERVAEQYALFMCLVGDFGAVLMGAVFWLLRKRRLCRIAAASL